MSLIFLVKVPYLCKTGPHLRKRALDLQKRDPYLRKRDLSLCGSEIEMVDANGYSKFDWHLNASNVDYQESKGGIVFDSNWIKFVQIQFEYDDNWIWTRTLMIMRGEISSHELPAVSSTLMIMRGGIRCIGLFYGVVGLFCGRDLF